MRATTLATEASTLARFKVDVSYSRENPATRIPASMTACPSASQKCDEWCPRVRRWPGSRPVRI
jgi:hypothetical protein